MNLGFHLLMQTTDYVRHKQKRSLRLHLLERAEEETYFIKDGYHKDNQPHTAHGGLESKSPINVQGILYLGQTRDGVNQKQASSGAGHRTWHTPKSSFLVKVLACSFSMLMCLPYSWLRIDLFTCIFVVKMLRDKGSLIGLGQRS